MKDLYLYNFLKTYKGIEKYYSDYDDKTWYTNYLMIGKFIIAFVYPLYRLEKYLDLNMFTSGYRKFYGLVFITPFLIFYFFYIRKNIKKIIKRFENKTQKEINHFKILDYSVKILIIFLNIILIFWI